jgi:[ribosomal protein S5]-alanine N-acetyltransferase
MDDAGEPEQPQLTDTGRLLLRRPTPEDLDDLFRIHGDERTNEHNPAGPDRDRAASRERLAEWLDHWRRHGFGYWTVETVETSGNEVRGGTVVGFAGLRHETWLGRPVLNLYYRLAREHWGRGYASELARHAVRWAASNRPDVPVLARTRPENIGSQRTAEAAGLQRRPDLEVDDNAGHIVVLVTPWHRRPAKVESGDSHD